jgi:hypothetical protein
MLVAQESRVANDPPGSFIQSYQDVAGTYAALFNGKLSMPYDKQSVNHPYFEAKNYEKGTLNYNNVVYKDILMRIDLFRDEISVMFPDMAHRIVLQNEMIHYAVLYGATFVVLDSGNDAKHQLLVLLHDGLVPVVRRYKVTFIEETRSFRTLTRVFRTQIQVAVCIDGEIYFVKNKNAILKLFPDRKQELNEYAKRHKLNFRKQTEQSIIALVNHYENMN